MALLKMGPKRGTPENGTQYFEKAKAASNTMGRTRPGQEREERGATNIRSVARSSATVSQSIESGEGARAAGRVWSRSWPSCKTVAAVARAPEEGGAVGAGVAVMGEGAGSAWRARACSVRV